MDEGATDRHHAGRALKSPRDTATDIYYIACRAPGPLRHWEVFRLHLSAGTPISPIRSPAAFVSSGSLFLLAAEARCRSCVLEISRCPFLASIPRSRWYVPATPPRMFPPPRPCREGGDEGVVVVARRLALFCLGGGVFAPWTPSRSTLLFCVRRDSALDRRSSPLSGGTR
jgi:hypothetical protein